MEFFMFDTPIGPMALSEEDGVLTRLYLPNTPTPRIMPRETPLLCRARDQILEYLDGERKSFDLPLCAAGTDFQQKVWTALREIPWGETRTYGQIAWQIGAHRASRAVGMVCRQNPLPILIPCHRVVGADGSLTGYAGGVELKKHLLELEGATCP